MLKKHLFVTAALSLAAANLLTAQVPRTISFQGVVTDDGGVVLPDGDYKFTLELHVGPDDGFTVWHEEQDGVPVVDGVFTVVLGSVVPLELPFDRPYYLSVAVNDDAPEQPFLPLTATPYTLGLPDSVVTDRKIADGQVVRSVNGITDAVELAAGTNVSLAVQGQKVFITATGGGDGSQFDGYSLDAVDGDPIDALFVDENGRVGIGTVQPTEQLDVRGNLALPASAVEGQDTTGVIKVGGKRFIHSIGTNNLFAGTDAGNLSVSADDPEGSSNTGVGARALSKITTGEANTALGASTLTMNDTGNLNIAIGNAAMLLNTSGNSNVAIGDHALQNNSTAYGNVAIGSEALVFNETGANNIAIGVGSLSNNKDGNGNVGVGSGTLGNANKGSSNTAIGSGVLISNGLGQANVGVGFGALSENEIGNFNTAVGNQAMATTTSGVGNTAIGSLARLASDGLNNATAIGTNAVVDASNKIRLGSNAVTVVEAHAAFHSLSGGFMFPDGTTQTTAAPSEGESWLVGTQLHVVKAINAAAALTNHVAIIENNSAGTDVGPDVLALKTSAVNPAGNTNMISFFDGNNSGIGRIEGNGSGGVVYGTTGGDYAEALPRLDPVEHIEKGDIVGLFDGRVTRNTAQAQHLMVVSSRPAVLGNAPEEGMESLYENVAFVGQVEIKVRGPVRAGDFIVPSGAEDGVGVTLAAERIRPEQLSRIVARAWETSDEAGVKTVNAVTGLPMFEAAAALSISEKEDRIRRLESRLDRMSQLVRELEKKVDQLRPHALAGN